MGFESENQSRPTIINMQGTQWQWGNNNMVPLVALSSTSTKTTVKNTNVETTLYSFKLPGNTIYPNGAIKVSAHIAYVNNGVVSTSFQLFLSFGGVSLFAGVWTVAAGASLAQIVDWYVVNTNATQQQLNTVNIFNNITGLQTAPVNVTTGQIECAGCIGGSDTSQDQNIVISCQPAAADNNYSVVLRFCSIAMSVEI